MARRVFFSFRYDDVWKVNQIRNIDTIIGCAAAGFQDASIWKEAKRMGDAAVQRLIDRALDGTTVTVVCVTYGTSTRKFINYEIDRSLERGNGLVAIRIHHLEDPRQGPGASRGDPLPSRGEWVQSLQIHEPDGLGRVDRGSGSAGR